MNFIKWYIQKISQFFLSSFCSSYFFSSTKRLLDGVSLFGSKLMSLSILRAT